MAEIVDCPGCKRKLQVPNDVVGQRVQCPTCAAVFVAGAAPAAPPLPPFRTEERRDDDFDDLPSRSRPRRPRYEDDYDDEPRSRRRRDWAPHRADLILVLGILGIVLAPFCSPIVGPMAWIMGTGDLAEMDAGRMDPSGRSNTNIGRILGIVSTCLLAIPVLFFCFFFALAGMLAAGR